MLTSYSFVVLREAIGTSDFFMVSVFQLLLLDIWACARPKDKDPVFRFYCRSDESSCVSEFSEFRIWTRPF